jgi:ADP-ribose pyrophosphatase YjhB (NUDIX family)
MKEQHKHPISTLDIIIEKDSRILLIKRKNSGLLFVQEGECV